MKPIRAALMLAAVAALTACSGGGLVSRNALASSPLLTAEQPAAPVPLHPSYKVTGIDVQVPAELVVNTSNSYKPRTDIVWHEDPNGDRRAQVDTIVTDALTRGVAGLDGTREVTLEVVVTRFHALTPRTRYSFGGTHDVRMILAVHDAATGALLEPAREIGFEIKASGGDAALAEEAEGLTQKVVISNELMKTIQYELTRPRDFLQG